MDMNEATVINNIVQLRNKKRLTQEYMADILGMTPATYSRIENSKIELSYGRLTGIASAFKMSVIDVITYPETYELRNNGNVGKCRPKVLVQLELDPEEEEEVLKVIAGNNSWDIMGAKGIKKTSSDTDTNK